MSSLRRLRTTLKWTAIVAILSLAAALSSFVLVRAEDNPLTTNGLPLFVLAGIFIVAWVGVVVLDFYRGLQEPTAPEASPESARSDGRSAPAQSRDPAAVYLERFARSNLYVGLLIGGFVAAYLVTDAVVGGGGATQILAAVHGFLSIGVRIFGGLSTLLVVTGVFIGLWYGLREAATEALLLGILAWGLMGFVGLNTLASSRAGLGLVIAGAYGVYYGVRARGTTEPRIVTGTTTDDY